MFSADNSGIWINWFAIAKQKYNKLWFGRTAPEIKFRRTGLGMFLMKIVQL